MSPSKSLINAIVIVLTVVLSAVLALRVEEISGSGPALLAFVSATWLFYNLSSGERIWDTIGMLIHPIKAAILFFFTSTVYFALQGYGTTELLLTGFGFFLVGGAIGILFFSYWDIGG